MIKRLLYISILLLACISCLEEPEYKVNSDLNVYLQRFLDEGKARGFSYDLKGNGLVMEFGDLEDDVAGRCYYENPIRIVIDPTYWNSISAKENSEELRENLVFHELGHGLLNRSHNNDYLANGDWKTIMCGGTEKDNRSWNINFRGIRRAYYLDELFDYKTYPAPWVNKTMTDNIDEAAVASDEFLTAVYWPIGNNENYTASVSGGNYTFQNKQSSGVFVIREVNILTTDNFYLESRFKFTSTASDAQCGLFFGANSSPTSGNYMLMNNNQRMFVGNSSCYGWYVELIKSQLINNDYNVLAIRKINQDMYYYINGVLVYYDQLTINKSGNYFGFEVGSNCTLSADYFHVSATTLRSASIASPTVIQPMPVPANSFKSLKK